MTCQCVYTLLYSLYVTAVWYFMAGPTLAAAVSMGALGGMVMLYTLQRVG
jgi:hypothetical protein